MEIHPLRRKRGFTLVELLVVIAIIGILVALLLPAVQQAREAANRNTCLNKFRQWSLSLQLHHDAHRRLPSDAAFNPNVNRDFLLLQLLPFIEEGSLRDNYNFSVSNFHPDNIALFQSPYAIFHCPSDTPRQMELAGPSEMNGDMGPLDYKSNYCFNWGNLRYGDLGYLRNLSGTALQTAKQSRGPFCSGDGVRYRSIKDGLSKTLAMMEIIQPRSEIGPGGNAHIDRRGRVWTNQIFTNQVVTYIPPNSDGEDEDKDRGHCWIESPDAPCARWPSGQSIREGYMGSRSRHTGGVLASRCDGSADFYSDDIDLAAWRALSTMAGQEVVDDGSL